MIYKLCEKFRLSKVTETVWQSGKSREKKLSILMEFSKTGSNYPTNYNILSMDELTSQFPNINWLNRVASKLMKGKMFIKSRRGIKAYPDQGFSVSARPSFGVALTAFESYSAEKVISDFGLHSRCNSVAIFPLSDNRVFTMVKGSIAWELPIEKLFW